MAQRLHICPAMKFHPKYQYATENPGSDSMTSRSSRMDSSNRRAMSSTSPSEWG